MNDVILQENLSLMSTKDLTMNAEGIKAEDFKVEILETKSCKENVLEENVFKKEVLEENIFKEEALEANVFKEEVLEEKVFKEEVKEDYKNIDVKNELNVIEDAIFPDSDRGCSEPVSVAVKVKKEQISQLVPLENIVSTDKGDFKVEPKHEFEENNFSSAEQFTEIKDINAVKEEYEIEFSEKQFKQEICVENLVNKNEVKQELDNGDYEQCMENFVEIQDMNTDTVSKTDPSHHGASQYISESCATNIVKLIININDCFRCEHCSKIFINRHWLEKHISKEHEIQKMSPTNTFLPGNDSSVPAGPQKCMKCGKEFQTFSKLKIHELTHSEYRPFNCSQCNKFFKTSKYLKHHKLIHQNIDPNICSQCGKSFISPRHLKLHELTHMNSNTCSKCGKAFITSEYLKMHEIIHQKSDSYSCLQCSKVFVTLSDLKYHALHKCGNSAKQQNGIINSESEK